MNDPETVFERNLERLLQKSCGPNARATAAMAAQLRRAWLAEARPQPLPAEFPIGVLGFLSAVLALLGMLAGVSGWSRGWSALGSVAMAPFGVLMLVNLLCVPVAGLVIILRRRNERAYAT